MTGKVINLNQSSAKQASQEEGYGEYIGRNIAKTPALLYNAVRTGFGLGDVADLIKRRLPTPEVQMPESWSLPGITTHGKSTEEAQNILTSLGASPETAKYYTESRPGKSLLQPGDAPIEFLLTELPFIGRKVPELLGKGAYYGAKEIGKQLLRGASVYGGATLGGETGKSVGKSLGDEEIGQVLGTLAGGLAGGYGAHRFENRPSKIFTNEKISEADLGSFRKDQAARIAKIEEELGPKIKNLSLEAKQKAIQKAVDADRVTQAKERFETSKQSKLDAIHEEIKNYDEKIASLREESQPAYVEAELQTKTKYPAKPLVKKANEVIASTKYGLKAGEVPVVNRWGRQIKAAIKKNKGNLPRNIADDIKKGINSDAHEYSIVNGKREYTYSDNARNRLKKLSGSLDDFIKETGTESQQAAYAEAQRYASEASNLQSKKHEFMKKKQEQIRRIKEQKFNEKVSKERQVEFQHELDELKENTKLLKEERSKALSDINKEKLQDFIKNKETWSDALLNILDAAPILNSYGSGAVGLVLGALFKGTPGAAMGSFGAHFARGFAHEANIAAKALRDHPNLYKEYTDVIFKLPEMTPIQTANALNALGTKIKDYGGKYDKKKNNGRVIDLVK